MIFFVADLQQHVCLSFRSVHRKLSAGHYAITQIRYTHPSEEAGGKLQKYVYELREVGGFG